MIDKIILGYHQVGTLLLCKFRYQFFIRPIKVFSTLDMVVVQLLELLFLFVLVFFLVVLWILLPVLFLNVLSVDWTRFLIVFLSPALTATWHA